MKKTALISGVIIFISLLLGSMSVDAQRWVVIGKKKVNYAVDHDEMIVTSARGDFKAIKIKVTKAALNMHRCVVHFGNGSQQEINLKKNFTPGSSSRVIDLQGRDRIIQRISFWYDTKNHARKRATVTVLARP